MLAIASRRERVVRFLLKQKNINPNETAKETPIIRCIGKNDVEILNLLI